MDILHVFEDKTENGYRYTVVYRNNKREFFESGEYDEKKNLREVLRLLAPVKKRRLMYEKLSPAGKKAVDELVITREYGSASNEFEYDEFCDYCSRDREYSLIEGIRPFEISRGSYIGTDALDAFSFVEGYCLKNHILIRQDYMQMTDLSLSILGINENYVFYQDAGKEYILDTDNVIRTKEEWIRMIHKMEVPETIQRSKMCTAGALAFDKILKDGEISLRELSNILRMEKFEVYHQLHNVNIDIFRMNQLGLFDMDGSYVSFVRDAVKYIELSKGYCMKSGLIIPLPVYVPKEVDSKGASRGGLKKRG